MMRFIIVDKTILYSDRKWNTFIQCVPAPENFLNKIRMSRNKIPAALGLMFNMSESEMKEYKDAKGEEALAEIVIRDCRIKGATLILKAKVNNEDLKDIKFIN